MDIGDEIAVHYHLNGPYKNGNTLEANDGRSFANELGEILLFDSDGKEQIYSIEEISRRFQPNYLSGCNVHIFIGMIYTYWSGDFGHQIQIELYFEFLSTSFTSIVETFLCVFVYMPNPTIDLF